jgi:hypothetical protein
VSKPRRDQVQTKALDIGDRRPWQQIIGQMYIVPLKTCRCHFPKEAVGVRREVGEVPARQYDRAGQTNVREVPPTNWFRSSANRGVAQSP